MSDQKATVPGTAFICNGGRTVVAIGEMDGAVFIEQAKALLEAAGHELEAKNLDEDCIIRRHALVELGDGKSLTLIWNTEGTSDDWSGRVTADTPYSFAITMTEV